MMKKLIALLLALIMVFALVACSGQTATIPAADNTPAAEEPAKADETPAADAPAAEETPAATGEQYKLACYWPAPDTYFDSYVLKGIEAFEADYGQDVEWMIGTDWTQDIENQSCEALAAQGYDLFMIFPADTTAANALFTELSDAGCEVVGYAGTSADPATYAVCYASDVYQMGYDSTKMLIEYMGGKGTLINVLENLNDVNTQKRQAGVEAAVAEYPDVTIVQTVGDIATVDEGFEKISDAIAANAGVDAIVTTGGTASIALANALTDYYGSNPDAKHIYAATVDQSPEAMAAIEAGYLDHTLAQNGYGQGYLSCLTLTYLKQGWEPIEAGKHINSGSLKITKENLTTWEKDLQEVTQNIAASIETDILKKP